MFTLKIETGQIVLIFLLNTYFEWNCRTLPDALRVSGRLDAHARHHQVPSFSFSHVSLVHSALKCIIKHPSDPFEQASDLGAQGQAKIEGCALTRLTLIPDSPAFLRNYFFRNI